MLLSTDGPSADNLPRVIDRVSELKSMSDAELSIAIWPNDVRRVF
jgi:hypothetical protein